MRCPACQKPVEPDAWLCPFCEHVIDPSVLGSDGDNNQDLAASEPTRMAPVPEGFAEEPIPDAVILGDVGIAADEFSVVESVGVQSDGRTSTFLYYATGSSTRVVHPDAVPRLTDADDGQPRTPYEDFILSCVDGARSVREIQKTSGLAPQEVVVTLLTLMDKGAVEIRTPDGRLGASPPIADEVTSHAEPPRPPPPDAETDVPDPEAPTGDAHPSVDRAAVVAPSVRAERAKSRRQRRARRMPSVVPQPLDPAEEGSPTQAAEIPVSARRPAPIPEGFSPEDSLPSVSDFHEIPADDLDSTQQGDEPPPLGLPDLVALETDPKAPEALADGSFSDVWAEAEAALDPPEASDPAAPWGPLSTADEIAAVRPPLPDDLGPPPSADPSPWEGVADARPPADLGLPDEDEAPLVVPRDLEAPPGEEDLDPVVPSALEPEAGIDDTREVFIPAKLRAGPGAAPRRAKNRAPSAVVGSISQSAHAPVLDPALLRPADPTGAKPAPRRPLAEVVKRAPIQERDRRRPLVPGARRPADPPERASPPPPPPPEPVPEAEAEGVDKVRRAKAHKLFEQAMEDRAAGNIISAKMNVKLAITFDPTRSAFQEALVELEAEAGSQKQGPRPVGRSKARELYDKATEAENLGDVDRAVELLEQALEESRQSAFLNRLGVILAMKKRNFDRAQLLIEEAIEKSPGNATYEKNLHKILSRAAADDVGSGKETGKKSGLLGFLGRRK